MLQLQTLRENRDDLAQALKKRNIDANPLLDAVVTLDEKRRGIQTNLDNILAQSNKFSKEIGILYKAGRAQEANALKTQTAELKEEAKTLTVALNSLIDSLNNALYQIPNIPHSSVPAGNTAADNEEVLREGPIPELGSYALPHWELAKKYDIIDFELGVKITGSGFPVYKGKGARLQRGLIAYFLDKNRNVGYTEIQVPYLVNETSGYGTGQLPDKEGQMYHVGIDNLYLIPTAEVPITNIFRDTIVDRKDLPISYTGYTPCFRREAGSYGADVRGLNRLHQFDKVEIVRVEHPKHSYNALDTMVDHVKEIVRELQLPFRILRLCGGDLGFTSALTYDFEVFSTAQDRWLEISSVSNFETYQSNRLKLRFRDENNKTQLAHTLNGSALALPRILAGILENYQTEKGIKIPEVLVPYVGFDLID